MSFIAIVAERVLMAANNARTRKAKGRLFEWYIANRYMDEGLYKTVRPMPESGALKEMPGDILVLDESSEFCEEAKRSERIAVWQWLEQAENQAKQIGKYPALHFKRNRSEVYTIIPFEVFLSMRKQLKENK